MLESFKRLTYFLLAQSMEDNVINDDTSDQLSGVFEDVGTRKARYRD